MDSFPLLSFSQKDTVWCKSGVAFYKADIIEIDETRNPAKYFVHYRGFGKQYDEWVAPERLMVSNKENDALCKEIYKKAIDAEKESKRTGSSNVQSKKKKSEKSKDRRKVTIGLRIYQSCFFPNKYIR